MRTKMNSWQEANQQYLTAALAIVQARLERHANRRTGKKNDQPAERASRRLQEVAASMSAPPALEALGATFGLSPFELEVVLLCAGGELSAEFATAVAGVQGNQRPQPTFALAMAALPAAHWNAMTPAAPLRYWRLIQVGEGSNLTSSLLRIDERILHYLTGIQPLDQRLIGIIHPCPPTAEPVPSQQSLAHRIAGVWGQATANPRPLIQLHGADTNGKRVLAAAASAELGIPLFTVNVTDLQAATNWQDLILLWEREALLGGGALLIEEDEGEDIGRSRVAQYLVEHTTGRLALACRDPTPLRVRAGIALEVGYPLFSEQRRLWENALGGPGPGLDGELDPLVSQFRLDRPAIEAVAAQVMGIPGDRTDGDGPAAGDLSGMLWDTCRVQARPRLGGLAQRIKPTAAWEDLVLPDNQRQVLKEMSDQVRQRTKVYETWGFAAKSQRGLGLSALFTGQSGTGKTMAAEVLAQELRLDLYRIDLSAMVSKYIGETEKNLRRVFDAAERSGAILLFDEADALFGKRTEVKDSHDRYANIEVSYLLQRVETYQGLAILTSNFADAIDSAFMRRIRFVVQFPFPGRDQRGEIWRRIFPDDTPVKDLDWEKLARLNVAGGNIRNIAMNAAFLAARDDRPVGMGHLQQAAQSEYAKLEKLLTDRDVGDWA